jgi:hypothetical protein
MEGYIFRSVWCYLSVFLFGLAFCLPGMLVADKGTSGSSQQTVLVDFTASAPSGGQMNNLVWTDRGLTPFRRNLQATYLSPVLAIDLQNLTPFFTVSLRSSILNFDPNLLSVQVRFSQTQEDWTDWMDLPVSHEVEPVANQLVSDMQIVEQSANFFQYLIVFDRSTSTSLPIWVQDLRINLFNPGNLTPIMPGPNLTTTLAGMDSSCLCPLPGYATRTNWGCPDGQNFSGGGSPAIMPTTHLIVHHSAGSNTSTNWAAVVLAIWNLHTDINNWADIGYNWLIDPNGVIYEGRGGGNNVRGAHFCGTNSGTMGVCMMGTYSNVPATPAAMESLAKLLAWKSCDSNLDPMGQTFHSPSGKSLPVIAGHRDGCSTLCPGDSLFHHLSGLRTKVQGIVDTCAKVASSISEELTQGLVLAPNPASENIYLEWQGTKIWRGQLHVSNLMGQQVFSQALQLTPGSTSNPISLPPSLQKGMYFVRLVNENSSWTKKLYWSP